MELKNLQLEILTIVSSHAKLASLVDASNTGSA